MSTVPTTSVATSLSSPSPSDSPEHCLDLLRQVWRRNPKFQPASQPRFAARFLVGDEEADAETDEQAAAYATAERRARRGTREEERQPEPELPEDTEILVAAQPRSRQSQGFFCTFSSGTPISFTPQEIEATRAEIAKQRAYEAKMDAIDARRAEDAARLRKEKRKAKRSRSSTEVKNCPAPETGTLTTASTLHRLLGKADKKYVGPTPILTRTRPSVMLAHLLASVRPRLRTETLGQAALRGLLPRKLSSDPRRARRQDREHQRRALSFGSQVSAAMRQAA